MSCESILDKVEHYGTVSTRGYWNASDIMERDTHLDLVKRSCSAASQCWQCIFVDFLLRVDQIRQTYAHITVSMTVAASHQGKS